jgi:hypothetical protein
MRGGGPPIRTPVCGRSCDTRHTTSSRNRP